MSVSKNPNFILSNFLLTFKTPKILRFMYQIFVDFEITKVFWKVVSTLPIFILYNAPKQLRQYISSGWISWLGHKRVSLEVSLQQKINKNINKAIYLTHHVQKANHISPMTMPKS